MRKQTLAAINMQEHDKQIALKSLDSALKHPINSEFFEPYDPNDPETKSYYQIVERPICFSAIQKNLEEGKYTSLKDYVDDVFLVWDNAIKFHGCKSLYGIAAIEAKKIFIKENTNLLYHKPSEWATLFFHLKFSINKHASVPPSKFKQQLSSLASARSQRNSSSNMTDQELINFSQAFKMLPPECMKGIVRIINENQSEIQAGFSDMDLDVSTLSPYTMRALRNYVEKQLSIRGLTYPN